MQSKYSDLASVVKSKKLVFPMYMKYQLVIVVITNLVIIISLNGK